MAIQAYVRLSLFIGNKVGKLTVSKQNLYSSQDYKKFHGYFTIHNNERL